jgi:hypothetical protein
VQEHNRHPRAGVEIGMTAAIGRLQSVVGQGSPPMVCVAQRVRDRSLA